MAITSSCQAALLCLLGLHTLSLVAGHGFIACPVGRSYLSHDAVLLELVPKDKPDMPKGANAINCGNRPNSGVGIGQPDFPATKLCGPCGDQIPLATGPVHEYQGMYDRGIIAGRFLQGDIATLTVILDNPHWGYMEFRFCPDVTKESQACLNENPLQIMNPSPGSNGSYQYYVDRGTRPRCSWDPTNDQCTMSQVYKVQVKLPDNISTERGVIQWNYVTGRSATGAGDFECKYPQCTSWEVFRGCADIRIDPYTTLLKSSYGSSVDLCMNTAGSGGTLSVSSCDPKATNQFIVPRQPWEDYKNRPFYIGFYDSGCATTCMSVYSHGPQKNAAIGTYPCKLGLADRKSTEGNQIWKIIPVTESIVDRHWEQSLGKINEDKTFLLQQGSQLEKNLCASVHEKEAGVLGVKLATCDQNDPGQRWTLATYPVHSL